MAVAQIILSFIGGFLVLSFIALIFKVKPKTYFLMVLNSVLGLGVLMLLNVLTIVGITPLSCFLVGFLGVLGSVLSVILAFLV